MMAAKCPHCRNRLIKAKNATTQFTYFWCPSCQLVHKDTDMDGVIG